MDVIFSTTSFILKFSSTVYYNSDKSDFLYFPQLYKRVLNISASLQSISIFLFRKAVFKHTLHVLSVSFSIWFLLAYSSHLTILSWQDQNCCLDDFWAAELVFIRLLTFYYKVLNKKLWNHFFTNSIYIFLWLRHFINWA